MKYGDNWQCPFCMHRQVLSTSNLHELGGEVASALNKHGLRRSTVTSVECMNDSCREIYLTAEFHSFLKHGDAVFNQNGQRVMSFLLRPSSIAKPQHASVPSPLVKDYEEACAIVGASPKAAATLARRCLQGMIRHFAGIKLGTLHAEINALKKQVEEGTAPRQVSDESIAAIDAVREIGNIGAHFEKDINIIVDVEPEEATALISLIELLFEEWYVARYERQERLAAVRTIAASKKSARAAVVKSDAPAASELAVDKRTPSE